MEDQFILVCACIYLHVCIKQVHEFWLQEYIFLDGNQRLNSSCFFFFEYVYMYMRNNLYTSTQKSHNTISNKFNGGLV